MSSKTCDNASVGVLAEYTGGNGRPRWLFIWRNTFPFSVAPVSGHVFDEHEHYTDAARAELKEEVGLEVTEVYWTPVGGWRPNRCRREPGLLGTGHQWEVYIAYLGVSPPDLKLSQREVRLARWLSAPQVQLLANRTLLYVQGRVDESDWREAPGIEPVWVGFLAELDVIRMPAGSLELIAEHMAEGRPMIA
jgi:ADP-ribose pyrophosphatase YjhB (NUDIX family)